MKKKKLQMSYTLKYILVMIQFLNVLIFTSSFDGKVAVIIKTFNAIMFLIIHTLLAKYSDFFKEGIL